MADNVLAWISFRTATDTTDVVMPELMVWTATQIARFMGPTWGPSGADRTQVGRMVGPWTLVSGYLSSNKTVNYKVSLNLKSMNHGWKMVLLLWNLTGQIVMGFVAFVSLSRVADSSAANSKIKMSYHLVNTDPLLLAEDLKGCPLLGYFIMRHKIQYDVIKYLCMSFLLRLLLYAFIIS